MSHRSPALLAPTRRTLVRGAAWSVPVVSIAAAAPAFAASPCDTPANGTVNFADGGNFTRASATAGQANVVLSDGTTLGVSFSSVISAGYTTDVRNMVAGAASVFPGNLALVQQRTDADNSTARGQKLTITFNRPVFNLVLPISSFSWPDTPTAYQDAAWVTPTPTGTPVNGSNVTGTGTSANPFRNIVSGPSTTVPYSGPTTTTTLTYSGGTTGISSVTVNYFDRQAGTGHAAAGLAILNMTFNAKKAGCP